MSDAGKPADEPTSALAPRQPTSFVAWRSELAKIRSGGALLDHLISPHDAPALVQRLPVEDLHRAIHEIGMADCTELVAMASDAQVQGILDHELWRGDQLDVDRLQPWMNALMQAGPDVLGPRLLGLDDELLNWIVRRTARVQIIEDPEDFEAPDVEHVTTPDNRLVIYFPNGTKAEDETELAEIRERNLPIKVFLDWLMRVDSVLCVDLLIHSSAALDSHLEENAYRWRKGRMADRGYVDYYDAMHVYTAPRPDQIRAARHVAADGVVPGARWLRPVLAPDERVGRAFAALAADIVDDVQQSLAYLVNMALSADRVEPWDQEHQAEVMHRVHAGLSLGLDVLAGVAADAAQDAQVFTDVSLTIIFRTGYGRVLEAAKPVRVEPITTWLAHDEDPVGALGLPVLAPWAEALVARHPTRSDGGPLANGDDLDTARRTASLIADLAIVAGDARPDDVTITAWLTTGLARQAIGLDGFAPLPAARLAEVHAALFAAGALRPDAKAAAHAWWTAQGGREAVAIDTLLRALENDLAGVAPSDLEPRYAPSLRFE